MGRSYVEQNGDGGGWGDARPPWDSAEEASGLRAYVKLGGTAPSQGAPSRRVPDNCFISELEEGQFFLSRPQPQLSLPRGRGGE